MFVLEPGRGRARDRRVLRPGGRVAVAVWGPRERNPWLGLVLDAVSAQIGRLCRRPASRVRSRSTDADELGALLSEARAVRRGRQELPVPLRAASFDEWWSEHVCARRPARQDARVAARGGHEALRARAREAVADYETANGLELPGVTLLASGSR